MSNAPRRRQQRRIRQLQRIVRVLLSLVLIEAAVILLLLVRGCTHSRTAEEQVPYLTTLSCIQTPALTEVVEPTKAPEVEDQPTKQESGYLHIEEIPLSFELQEVMQKACAEYDVPYSLALAMAERESTFDLDAQNSICYGVMQIHHVNYGRLRGLGIEPTEHEGNIVAGVFMIGELLDKYGDTHRALMAYNCGERGAANLWQQGYTSSQYSRQVVSLSEKWQQIIDENEW